MVASASRFGFATVRSMAVRTSPPQLLQQLMLRQPARVVAMTAVVVTAAPVVMATVVPVVTTTSNF